MPDERFRHDDVDASLNLENDGKGMHLLSVIPEWFYQNQTMGGDTYRSQ